MLRIYPVCLESGSGSESESKSENGTKPRTIAVPNKGVR